MIATERLPGRRRNRPIKDYAGLRFGRLVALALVERSQTPGAHLWKFKCDCGADHVCSVKSAVSGHTSSCGCLAKEVLVARSKTHGLRSAWRNEYRSWRDMRQRCANPQNSDYANYGARGIRVCERWDDFALFVQDMGRRPAGTSIERIDVNGDYEPENCRWATALEQANNKRTNHVIKWRGRRQTLAQWCRELRLEPSKVRYRLSVGKPLDLAFSTEDFRR